MINCVDAAFAYEGNTVISGLNFSVNPGDYLCIVGENGAGKSTLLRGLLGLKKPSHGVLTRSSENGIGYLPQVYSVRNDFPASVLEVTLSGRLAGMKRRFYNKEDVRTAHANLRLLDADGYINSSFAELSGGQQRRVLLARALTAATDLLILDEATASLDPLVTKDFYKSVEKLNRERGIAVVSVTHDLPNSVLYAKHILALGEGRQLFYGTTEDWIFAVNNEQLTADWEREEAGNV
jgi:zinc transport system ATP-binding protein